VLKKILVFILLLVLVIVGYRLIKPKNSISTSTSDVTSDISTNSTFTSTDFEDIAPTYVDSDTNSSYISNSHRTVVLSPTVAKFSCDGRQHCSQMTSCAEATYFIQHCPNTKMDGNHDGVPCEQQWCN